MTIRKILTFPDPKLREVAKEVTNFDSNLKELANDLLETMYEFKGIGLAAIQIGIPKRIKVMNISKYRKKNPIYILKPTIKNKEKQVQKSP